MKKILITTFSIVLLCAACGRSPAATSSNNSTSTPSASGANYNTDSATASSSQISKLFPPISNALSRVTKKPFGIYITPKTSPVQPERFTGYHTGVDFETTPAEQNLDVPIFAACDGKLLMARYASGYGGVAVQSCKLNGADVTLIYGHIRLSSVTIKVGSQLKAGQQIAVLGTGYSSETDGERKHLHFGIHKGTSINILGYVQQKSQLSNWLDATQYLK